MRCPVPSVQLARTVFETVLLAYGCPVDRDHPARCANLLAGAARKRDLELAEHLKAQDPDPDLTPAGA